MFRSDDDWCRVVLVEGHMSGNGGGGGFEGERWVLPPFLTMGLILNIEVG